MERIFNGKKMKTEMAEIKKPSIIYPVDTLTVHILGIIKLSLIMCLVVSMLHVTIGKANISTDFIATMFAINIAVMIIDLVMYLGSLAYFKGKQK